MNNRLRIARYKGAANSALALLLVFGLGIFTSTGVQTARPAAPATGPAGGRTDGQMTEVWAVCAETITNIQRDLGALSRMFPSLGAIASAKVTLGYMPQTNPATIAVFQELLYRTNVWVVELKPGQEGYMQGTEVRRFAEGGMELQIWILNGPGKVPGTEGPGTEYLLPLWAGDRQLRLRYFVMEGQWGGDEALQTAVRRVVERNVNVLRARIQQTTHKPPGANASPESRPPVLVAANAASVTNGITLGQVIGLLGPGWRYSTDVGADRFRWSFSDGRELAAFSPGAQSTNAVLSIDLESPTRFWFTTNYVPDPSAKPVGAIKFALAKELVPPSASMLREIDQAGRLRTAFRPMTGGRAQYGSIIMDTWDYGALSNITAGNIAGVTVTWINTNSGLGSHEVEWHSCVC